MTKNSNTKVFTYKVWLEIEHYNEATGTSEGMDTPGASLASFGSYDEAYDFVTRVTDLVHVTR